MMSRHWSKAWQNLVQHPFPSMLVGSLWSFTALAFTMTQNVVSTCKNCKSRPSHFFCTLLCRHSTTKSSKCLISRFVENQNARQGLSFSLPDLRYIVFLNSTPEKNAYIWRIEWDGMTATATATTKKAIGLMIKTTTLHAHHNSWSISLPSLHNYDVKWPNFKFTKERYRQGDKFYHLCLNSGAGPLSSLPT